MGSSTSKPGTPSGECPVVNTRPATEESSCPVPAQYRNPAVYNVYGQRVNDPNASKFATPLDALRGKEVLDPKNNMPLEANQQPVPGQMQPLSTQRMQSTIPKGGTDSTWLYPSPQMFYNALKRKGKGDDVTETHMDAVVWAHNSMNERTWKHVMVWEKLHQDVCGEPTLLRFRGRPDELSPLARLRALLGGPEPFDRHDWVIDRCGQEVRYVIDFYYYDDKAGTPEAFEITVRPALDSVDAALDRLKMNIYTNFARWGLPCPVSGQEAVIGSEALKTSSSETSSAGS